MSKSLFGIGQRSLPFPSTEFVAVLLGPLRVPGIIFVWRVPGIILFWLVPGIIFFQASYGRAPFLEASWHDDSRPWKLTYLVEVDRASDVTLELAHYRKPHRQRRRKQELTAQLVDVLERAFASPSQNLASSLLLQLEEFGNFVVENILVMGAFCEAMWQPPWRAEVRNEWQGVYCDAWIQQLNSLFSKPEGLAKRRCRPYRVGV